MTFPGAYALMAKAYFEVRRRSGGSCTRRGQNHENALPNEKAQYRSAITVEDALEAPWVSTPLGLYDSCPISDGAAALVLTSEAYAEENDLDAPVAITGTGQGATGWHFTTANTWLVRRQSGRGSVRRRRRRRRRYRRRGGPRLLYDRRGARDRSLDIEGVGEGISAARDGRTTADGETPINPRVA